MPKYVIERTLPGAGSLTPEELRSVSAKSAAVGRELGPDVQWQHSYVTDDKIYCVYNAANAEIIREHAHRGGFPCDSVSPVAATIDTVTAEA